MKGQTWRAVPVLYTGPLFDKITNKYQLAPESYPESDKLRTWVRKNYRSKYVPEDLLKLWGFSVDDIE